MKCNKCNGNLDSQPFCSKCNGTGEVDWIEQIVGKKPVLQSPLNKINVRRLVLHIQKTIEKCIDEHDINYGIKCSETLCHDLKVNRGIYDYCISSGIVENEFKIMIQPYRSVNQIHISFKINDEQQ